MTEAIEPTKKRKKKPLAWLPSPAAPRAAPAVAPSAPTRPERARTAPNALDRDHVELPTDNVFADAPSDAPRLSARTQKFLAQGGDKKLAALDIDRHEFDRWITTGEESANIRAAREKMQAAKSDIRKEMSFFQAALPVYVDAARERGDVAAAEGAQALHKGIGGYEQQAYRLWIDRTKANVHALDGMARQARTDAAKLRSSGDHRGADALEKKAASFEASAAKQRTTITKTLVVRKEAVKSSIERTDEYKQSQRSQHTAYSDEIAELQTDAGRAEAEAMQRHVERSKTNGYDPMTPQSLPDSLGGHPPKGAFIGGAQHYLDEAERYDFRASEDAGHLAAVGHNARVRSHVATTYLGMNGYPPKKGTPVVVNDRTKGLMKHQVDGLLTEQGAAKKRIEQLEAKADPSAAEAAELNGLRKDVMSLATRIESTKQTLATLQQGPRTRAQAKKAIDEELAAAGAMKSDASETLAQLDKRRDEIADYEHSDPEYFADYSAKYAAARTEADMAKKRYDDALRASWQFDLHTAGADPVALADLANAGAGVIVEAFGAREPPGHSTDSSVIAGGGYQLAQYGPSTQDVLAPGVAAAEKIARVDEAELTSPDARDRAFEDAEATANFYADAARLSARPGRSTPESKRLSTRAIERADDAQAVLDATPNGAKASARAERTVRTQTNVAVKASVDDPAAARRLLRTANANVNRMTTDHRAEGRTIVTTGAAAHAQAISNRRPPPQDSAYDQAITLGRALLAERPQFEASDAGREQSARWKAAEKRLDRAASAPERFKKMIDARRAAAKRARDIALANAKWDTREGKDLASGSISYLADVAYYGSGPLGWAATKPPSEQLDQAAGDLAAQRAKWIEDGYAAEMAALDQLETMSASAAKEGRWGEFRGALASSDASGVQNAAGVEPRAAQQVVRFVQLDKTALGSTTHGSSAKLDVAGAERALGRQTAPTNASSDRAVGEAREHLDTLQNDDYFRFVPLPIAVGETAVEMIATAGISSSASVGKAGLKAASLMNRAGRVGRGAVQVAALHNKASQASKLYSFGSKVAAGYALMETQKAVTLGMRGKVFAKGSFGEKAMNASIGLAGDLGQNRIAGMKDLGRKMIMPSASIVATMGVVPYMQKYGGWTPEDAERFTKFIEGATIVGGAAHGVHAERRATPDSTRRRFDDRVAELKAKHGDLPIEVIRERAYREVRTGLNDDASKKALDLHHTAPARRLYATDAATRATAGLAPESAGQAKPIVQRAVEAHRRRIDAGEVIEPNTLRTNLEIELGALKGPDGKPRFLAVETEAIAKTVLVETATLDALRVATDSKMQIESPEQLDAVVRHQQEALVRASEGRVPPLFSTAEIHEVGRATVDQYTMNRASARAGEHADANRRAPSGRETVAFVQKEATALRAKSTVVDVERVTARAAVDVATREYAATSAGRAALDDPKRTAAVERKIRQRAVELGAKPGAVDSVLDGRRIDTTDPQSITLMKRVNDATGRPIEGAAGWVFEEHAGYELLRVDQKSNTADVRDAQGRVSKVSLDDVVFEHNGVTFGAQAPLEMQRIRERYDALGPAEQAAWRQLMGDARKVSPEHAALTRRILASGESVAMTRKNFEHYKTIPRQDLAKQFSMEGHVQHYEDSCAATGGCQTPLGWMSPLMGEAITKYPQAVAEQQRREIVHVGGSTAPREGTADYRGRANLDANAYIPPPAGTAAVSSTAAMFALEPRLAIEHDRHNTTRLDPHAAPNRLHEILGEGQRVLVTMRQPGSTQEVAAEITGPHAHPDGPRVRVREAGRLPYSARLETAYVGGRPQLSLGGQALTAIAVPKGIPVRGNRQGMFFDEGRHVVHDLETMTGKTYKRRSVRDFDANQRPIPDPARVNAIVDQTIDLAANGYPVLLEVDWQSGGRHQIAVKPGTRKNANGETELFVHDPWVDRGRWMTGDELARYQLGGEHGEIVAMGVPKDTPQIGNVTSADAYADSVRARAGKSKDPLVEQKGWTDDVLSRRRFWSMYPNRDLRKQTTRPADVALDLAQRDGVTITGFEKSIEGPNGNTLGEIDVRTNYAIVEVTVSGYTGSKTSQMQDRLRADGGAVNPHGLPVIFYGGKPVHPKRARSLHAQKVYVARSRAEVVRLHDAIAKKADKIRRGEPTSRADDIVTPNPAPKDFYSRVRKRLDQATLSAAWGVTADKAINGRVQEVYGKVAGAGPDYARKLDRLLAIADSEARTKAFVELERAVTYGQIDAVFERHLD